MRDLAVGDVVVEVERVLEVRVAEKVPDRHALAGIPCHVEADGLVIELLVVVAVGEHLLTDLVQIPCAVQVRRATERVHRHLRRRVDAGPGRRAPGHGARVRIRESLGAGRPLRHRDHAIGEQVGAPHAAEAAVSLVEDDRAVDVPERSAVVVAGLHGDAVGWLEEEG